MGKTQASGRVLVDYLCIKSIRSCYLLEDWALNRKVLGLVPDLSKQEPVVLTFVRCHTNYIDPQFSPWLQ